MTPPLSANMAHGIGDWREERIAELLNALEWALDQNGAEHPHLPYRDGTKWVYPYLLNGDGGFGGGVGLAHFDTAFEAVKSAMARALPAA